MRILVVEDDFVARSVMARFVDSLGTVDVAEDGAEAVELFRKSHDEGQPYALITLDIMMPRMNGHDALVGMRACEKERGIADAERTRVIITTALDDARNASAALRDICDDYLIKPIRKAILFEKIAELGFAVPS